jgi:hypothetical protein
MFKTRLEIIIYLIESVTGREVKPEEAHNLAVQYEHKPFIIKISCD